ncbi:MAG: hypothetical protein P4L46_26250 [Fimbriimonas sp.]|nr:hypothetical protein [Fimbriimonas sp.]
MKHDLPEDVVFNVGATYVNAELAGRGNRHGNRGCPFAICLFDGIETNGAEQKADRLLIDWMPVPKPPDGAVGE